MKRIILTGGGTAGHVTPNIALLPRLKDAGYEIFYIGSVDGMADIVLEQMKLLYTGKEIEKGDMYADATLITQENAE